MLSQDNAQKLNLDRHYKFSFFDVTNTGTDDEPYFITTDLPYSISDSFNFSISYSVTNSTSNTATFMFYNLPSSAIGLFTSTNNRRGFTLDVWYGNTVASNLTTIFRGLSFTVNTYRQGVDVITEVVGSDIFLNLQCKNISKSFPVGTTYLEVVNTVIRYYGQLFTLDPSSNAALQGSYLSPKVFRGSLENILKRVASDAGCIYTVHNNTYLFIQVKKIVSGPSDGGVIRANPSVPVISDTNGLVGYIRAQSLSVQLIPVMYFSGIPINKNLSILSVSTLMRPYVPYSYVKLISDSTPQFNGRYGVLSASYEGEWRGNNWYTNLQLWPTAGNKQQNV